MRASTWRAMPARQQMPQIRLAVHRFHQRAVVHDHRKRAGNLPRDWQREVEAPARHQGHFDAALHRGGDGRAVRFGDGMGAIEQGDAPSTISRADQAPPGASRMLLFYSCGPLKGAIARPMLCRTATPCSCVRRRAGCRDRDGVPEHHGTSIRPQAVPRAEWARRSAWLIAIGRCRDSGARTGISSFFLAFHGADDHFRSDVRPGRVRAGSRWT